MPLFPTISNAEAAQLALLLKQIYIMFKIWKKYIGYFLPLCNPKLVEDDSKKLKFP